MKHIFYISAALCLSASCLRLQTNPEFDDTQNWYSKFSMTEFLASSDNEFTIYSKAVSISGLDKDMNEHPGRTYLVPDDAAFLSFFADHSIGKIEDIPSQVLLEFLRYLEIKSPIKSTSLAPDETVPYVTAYGKPIYITRQNASANPYRLLINYTYPQGSAALGGPYATVTMQDIEFGDGNIAQVVDEIPYYAPIVESVEAYSGKLDSDKVTRMGTRIDTYIYNHTGFATAQVYKAICSNSERFPIVWYEQKELSFTEEISKAIAYFYHAASTNEGLAATVEYSLHDISSQIWSLTLNGTDTTKLCTAVCADYVPELNLDNYVTTFAPSSSQSTWFAIDVTSFIKKYYNTLPAQRKPIAFSMMPTTKMVTSSGLLSLGWKNESNKTDNNSSYIEIIGPVPSKTEIVRSNPLSCPKGGSALLTEEQLLRQAKDAGELNLSARNITYSLASQPQHGTLTLNGIPLSNGVFFSQAHIAAGVVKYYNTDAAASTDVLHLKGSDYTGSTVADEIDIAINIIQ